MSGAPCARFSACDPYSLNVVAGKCQAVCPDHAVQQPLPPPVMNKDPEVRVAKGFGTKGYDQLRISVVSSSQEPPVPDFFDYSGQFAHRWNQFFLHTTMKTVQPGIEEGIYLGGGRDITVKLPRRGDGIAGLLISDPCVNSPTGFHFLLCDHGARHHTLERLPALINAFAAQPEIDFWSLAGDNFYDRSGQITADVYTRISLKAKSKIFLSAPGNHDYWIYGSPQWGNLYDQCANGFMQYYTLDTKAAQNVLQGSSAAPFDYSVHPFQGREFYLIKGFPSLNWTMGCNLPKVSNFFWYHQIGNVGFIGQSGAHTLEETMPYMKEACAWVVVQPDLDMVLLYGHWDVPDSGAQSGMDLPSWYFQMSQVPGCREFALKGMLKFVMGHTHCNNPHPHPDTNITTGFRVAGFGMGGCGNFGIPVLDTTEARVRLWYFDTSANDKYINVINCVLHQGWRACTNLATLWLDQPILRGVQKAPELGAAPVAPPVASPIPPPKVPPQPATPGPALTSEPEVALGGLAPVLTASQPPVTKPSPARPPAKANQAWKCWHYENTPNPNEWCKNAGVQAGQEVKFFGPGGPCGDCWCCSRPVQ